MISRRALVLAGACILVPTGVKAAVQLAQAEKIVLGAQPTRVMLQPAAGVDLAGHVEKAAERRFTLVLRGLAADRQPGAVYSVFLNLPEGAEPKADDPGFVGTVSFFGAPKSSDGTSRRAISYEVSEALARLQSASRLGGALYVTIAPGRAPAPDSRPTIAEIGLYENPPS
jgi:hypothetical protein